MTLEEHLHDARQAAEVAIDLKRGMSVEQVGIGTRRSQEGPENRMGMLRLAQTSPQIQPPRDSPAGRFVAPDFEGTTGGGREGGRPFDRDLAARVKAVEMRHVPVMHLRRLRVPIFQPFLQLPRGADLMGREPRAGVEERLPEVRIDVQEGARFDAMSEEVAENLSIHRRSGTDRGAFRVLVLRRDRGAGDEPSVFGLFDQGIEKEERRAFENRIDVGQVGGVAPVVEVIPERHA